MSLFLMGWMAVDDATASYDLLFHTPDGVHGQENVFGYSMPDVDRLIEEAPKILDPERRLPLLQQIAQRVHEGCPIVPLYRQVDLYAATARLRFEPRPDRVILGRDLTLEP